MKIWKFLLIATFGILLAACSNDDDDTAGQNGNGNGNGNGGITLDGAAYAGIMVVDQNDGSDHVQQEVVVQVTTGDGSVTLLMNGVKFSPKMPISLDMTIPQVEATGSGESLALKGESIVPLAMGGEFPQYTITGMTGTLTADDLSFEMMCGDYPLKYTGTVRK